MQLTNNPKSNNAIKAQAAPMQTTAFSGGKKVKGGLPEKVQQFLGANQNSINKKTDCPKGQKLNILA